MKNIEDLQSHLAHLERGFNELSDVVARQDAEIARLTRLVELLAAREAEREAADGGSVPIADQKPPHW